MTAAPLDLDAIRRDADRMLTVWQEIQNTSRPGLVTDWTTCVEQSAEDVPPLVRYVTALAGEVEQWRATYGESALPGALNLMKQTTRQRDEARAEVARLRKVEQAARTLIAADRSDDPIRYARAIDDLTAALDTDQPEIDDASPTTDDIDDLLNEVRIHFADATSDDERAEAIAYLLSEWYRMWPDTAVVDPDPPLAAALLRLLAPWAAQVQQLQGPLAGYALVTVDAPQAVGCPVHTVHTVPLAGCPHPARGAYEDTPTLPERIGGVGEALPPLPDSAYPAGATPLEPADDGTCGATDTPMGMSTWRCTEPAGHTGGRHHSFIPALGSYTWGYVPNPAEADEVPPNAGSAT